MSKKNFEESGEIVANYVRTDGPDAVFSLHDKEYSFPKKLIPRDVKEGEKIVILCKRFSDHQESKERTAKELLNEILNG